MTIFRVVAVAVLWVSSSGLIVGQTTAESALEKQITGTLHQMYAAEKRRDLEFIHSHLADDFAEVAGDGKVYRWPDIQAGFKDVVLKDYNLTDCIFKLMTSDAAYLSCKMDVVATAKGQPFPARFRVTYIWTRESKDWLLRFEQGTVIPEPAKSKEGKQE